VDRRRFLKRLGFGGAGLLGVGAPAGSYIAGRHLGEVNTTRHWALSASGGERNGHASVWWSVGTDEKKIALTFDDGPTTRFTPEVLDILDRYEVAATFFLIGELVTRQPSIVMRMIEAGHELGNHTFDHFDAAGQSPSEVRRSMEQGADAVANLLGDRPRWFRPVKGHITGALLNSAVDLGHDIALWSVGRGAPAEVRDNDVEGVRGHMTSLIEAGSVMIFHDGIGRSEWEWSGPDPQLITQRRTEINALPEILEDILAQGFEFTTLSALVDHEG
jgi:peptidoglycan/xylan/chitin deacetylase (PgdA/CDA1 family)